MMSLLQRETPPEQYPVLSPHGESMPIQFPGSLVNPIPHYVQPQISGNLTHNGWNYYTPGNMSWSVPATTGQQLIRFQGEPTGTVQPPRPETKWWDGPIIDFTDTTSFTNSPGTSQKRKLDNFIDGPLQKQFISEEKMAAELDRLHITPRTDSDRSARLSAQDDSLYSRVAGRLPTLVLSDELKKLQREPIIPPSLLESFNKPSMAVVLWKPPGGLIKEVVRRQTKEPEKDQSSGDQDYNVGVEEMQEDPASVENFENNNNVPYINREDVDLDL